MSNKDSDFLNHFNSRKGYIFNTNNILYNAQREKNYIKVSAPSIYEAPSKISSNNFVYSEWKKKYGNNSNLKWNTVHED